MGKGINLQIGEFPAVAVGRFLSRKGLTLSDIAGNKLDRVYPGMWGIGILEDHPHWPAEMRYRLTARIDFFNYDPDTRNGYWVFSVIDEARLCEFRKLVEEITERFKVEVAFRKKVFAPTEDWVKIRCEKTTA